MSTLTVVDMLLVAAANLEAEGKKPFTAEDLVVAAWQAFPKTFGLRGYLDEDGDPKYPDSNRVFAEVMGTKPIRKRGLLVKTGPKLYELTGSGSDLARTVQARAAGADGAGDLVGGRMTISRKSQGDIEKLLKTRAVEKFDNGRREEITFHDACLFWGISPRSSAIELEGRVAHIETRITSLQDSLDTGGNKLKTGNESMQANTAGMLRQVHEYMMDAFEGELSVIKRRVDQRKP